MRWHWGVTENIVPACLCFILGRNLKSPPEEGAPVLCVVQPHRNPLHEKQGSGRSIRKHVTNVDRSDTLKRCLETRLECLTVGCGLVHGCVTRGRTTCFVAPRSLPRCNSIANPITNTNTNSSRIVAPTSLLYPLQQSCGTHSSNHRIST